jgi:hypothetical protein
MIRNRTKVVPKLEELIGHSFHTKEYAWEAFQCKGTGEHLEGNKRLALLGDVSIGMKSPQSGVRLDEGLVSERLPISSFRG